MVTVSLGRKMRLLPLLRHQPPTYGRVDWECTHLDLQAVGHNVGGVDDDVVDGVQGLVGHVLGQQQRVAAQAHNAELGGLQQPHMVDGIVFSCF